MKTKRSQIDTFLAFMNIISLNTKFTCEKEEKNSIAFPDTRIAKTSEGTLHFCFYRRLTSNDRYLDYDNNNLTTHKYNSALALQRRACRACSNEANKIEEIKRDPQDLLTN